MRFLMSSLANESRELRKDRYHGQLGPIRNYRGRGEGDGSGEGLEVEWLLLALTLSFVWSRGALCEAATVHRAQNELQAG